MSVAPLSSARPSAATLEQALRHAVQKVFNSGNLENLTVKRVRKSVEVGLDLGEDFFKTDVTWTSKSKLVIQAEVVRVDLGYCDWPIANPTDIALGSTSRNWRKVFLASLEPISHNPSQTSRPASKASRNEARLD